MKYYFRLLRRWLARKDITFLQTRINELETKGQALRWTIKLLEKQLADAINAIRTSEYVTEKLVMRPTEAIMERIKKGKVCAACCEDLKTP